MELCKLNSQHFEKGINQKKKDWGKIMKIIKQNCLKYLINREIISSENNFFLFIETVLSIRIIVLDFGLFLGFPFGNVQSVLIICNGQAPVVPVSQSTVQCVNRIRKSWLTKKKKKTVFLTSS